MRLYLAIPSCRDWKPHFGASLCGLVGKLSKDGVDFTMNAMMGTSVLPKARQVALEHAIQEGYSHVLFLDDDMAFQSDIFDRLSSHNKEVIGANYSNKSPQRNPQAHALDGSPMSSKDRSGIEEIGWLGFGGILIALSAIKDVPKPWFETRWVDERKSFIGEDYYFCGKVRANGVRIYVDHDVKMQHIGDAAYQE